MTSAALGALAAAAAALALGLIPLGGAWIPRPARHPDATALSDAGWAQGLGRWELIRAGVAGAGVALAIALGVPPPAGLIVGLAPSVVIRIRAQSARDRARGAVARILVDTHAMLRSGVSFPDALRRAARGCADPLARRPFEVALERFDLGDALDDAIRSVVTMSTDRRLVAILHTLALGVSERLPIQRAASLVEAMADRAVHDDRLDAEIRARTAGIRVQSYLLAGIVPCLALYLVATMPGLAATLSTPLGRTVLIPGALGLEICGIVMNRRIVRAISR